MQKAVGQSDSRRVRQQHSLHISAEGCTTLVLITLQSSIFPQQQQSPYPQEMLFWDHGAGCWQVQSTHISVRWVCFPTLRIFTLKMFSIFILKTDRDPLWAEVPGRNLAMVLAIDTYSSPWDHESLRFRLTQHTQGLRAPDPKQRLLLWHICASPPWVPSTGSLTGVYPAPGCLLRVAMAVWCWD